MSTREHRRRCAAWRARLVLLLALLAIACSPRDPRLDVVMLVVDTLRADHLGLYGYPRETSPALDRFAESAVVFDRVFSTSSWTLPAVGSLMTGAYPSSHDLRARIPGREGNIELVSLSPAFTTLARSLQDDGYRTVAIANNPWVTNRQHGLDRGFETFVVRDKEVDAETLNALAREELERDDSRPLFLYVHYMDVHGPYEPARPNEPKLSPLPRALQKPLGRFDKLRLPNVLRIRGASRLGDYVEAYDIGIRRWDDAFGRLLDWLEESGRLDSMVLTVVADHGEELLDHGGWNHGETLHQEQLHVPWLLRAPGQTPRRIASPVSLVDVMPTLLGRLGSRAPELVAGIDVLAGTTSAERNLYAETDVKIGGELSKKFAKLAMRRGDRKWVIERRSRTCYDLARDPLEKLPRQPGPRCPEEGFSALERWAAETRRSAAALPRGRVGTLSEDDRLQLRELGYLE